MKNDENEKILVVKYFKNGVMIHKPIVYKEVGKRNVLFVGVSFAAISEKVEILDSQVSVDDDCNW